ncbi:hypothetical protein, partial [Alkalimonas mucilaginosa]
VEWAFCFIRCAEVLLTHACHRGGIAKHFPVFRPSGLPTAVLKRSRRFSRHAGSVHHPAICEG